MPNNDTDLHLLPHPPTPANEREAQLIEQSRVAEAARWFWLFRAYSDWQQCQTLMLLTIEDVRWTVSAAQIYTRADHTNMYLTAGFLNLPDILKTAYINWSLLGECFYPDLDDQIRSAVRARLAGIDKAFEGHDGGKALMKVVESDGDLKQRIITRANIQLSDRYPSASGVRAAVLAMLEKRPAAMTWAEAGEQKRQQLQALDSRTAEQDELLARLNWHFLE